MVSSSTSRTKVFISYSHKDVRYLRQLQTHLAYYEQVGLIEVWDDTKLSPGTLWQEEIKNALRQTTVAILLVSAAFLASKFIVENELPPLLAAAQSEGAVILSVILSACAFEDTELAQFQAVNSPSIPVAKMKGFQRDELWAKVAREIGKVVIPQQSQNTTISSTSTATPAKQRDDEQYTGYVETWVKYIDLDNWTYWTARWILASTRPEISYTQLKNLEELELWLLSTIWPKRYPELDAAFENFRRILHDLVSIHYRYSTSDEEGNYSVTDKYLQHYSSGSRGQRLTTEGEKRKEYKWHLELFGDLMLELTRATNYICDKVRQFIDPTFRIQQGATLITFDFGDYYRTEYRGDERILYPYPGLKQFEKDRKKRDIDRSRYGLA